LDNIDDDAAAEAIKVLKEKLSNANINPVFITITNVYRKGNVWIIEFTYMFRTYVAELDASGKLLSLRSKTILQPTVLAT